MESYQRIRRIPNVRLIDWNFDARELVRHARGVVTSASSMGFEAILPGKPVFVLGHPFYDFHPLVRRINSWDDAFRQFLECDSISATDREVLALVEAYFMSSLRGSYDLKTSADNIDVVEAVAQAIVNERAANEIASAENLY